MRCETTQQTFDNLIYRAKRWGLNAGQQKVLRGLNDWFEENPEGPSMAEIAEVAGVSRSMVWWTIPVLEALGYVTVSRNRNGRLIPRSVRLWVEPEDIIGKAG